MGPDVTILLISGSTRSGSANTAALRTLQALTPPGVTAQLYQGLADLPAFNPDDEPPPEPAAGLRAQIAAADALLFCTPEYAGTLPGSLKNLLDWTVGGGEIYGKPVGWINVAVGGRGTGAEEHLAMVLRYVGAVAVAPACVRVPVPREAIGPDGTIIDPPVRAALVAALSALAGGRLARPVRQRPGLAGPASPVAASEPSRARERALSEPASA
jgi:chromate reductase, NAD(P)H dehydrogenase (quinone)